MPNHQQDVIQNEYQPDYAVSPGEVLSYELELRGMSQQELARRTGITPKHIHSILNAKTIITPDMAIKLERALNMPVQYWLNLEALYQEVLARKAEEAQLEADLNWLTHIPVKQMANVGWVKLVKDKKAQLVEVLRFFGIAKVSQWSDMWPNIHIAYRQSQIGEVYPEAVSAWLRQGELEASKIVCKPFDKAAFRVALDSIRTLTSANPDVFVPRMVALCADAGVAVVFVPMLPKTGVSGATRWLNKDKAIIQLSLRYKSNDHLWFTFFHEAGHIMLHGKKEMFLEGAKGLDPDKEAEANVFAEKELIPAKAFNTFITQGVFSKQAIVMFAKAVDIAPGVVVGQLQHKSILNRSFCNDLKQRYEWAHE